MQLVELPKFCGANLWCDWTWPGPLRDRLWEYIGKGSVNGIVVYQWIPYKRRGNPLILSMDDMYNRLKIFRPFLISTDEPPKQLPPPQPFGGYSA